MISQEALDNFHKLVSIASEPCKCNEDDTPCCRSCAAKDGLEHINKEIAEILEDIAFE